MQHDIKLTGKLRKEGFKCWVTEIHAIYAHNELVSARLIRSTLFQSQYHKNRPDLTRNSCNFMKRSSFIAQTEQQVVGCIVV